MRFHSLASGSKGNAFVVENGTCKLMIDAGTTQKKIKENLQSLGLTIDLLDCVLITHDHSDHISAIKLFKNHTVYSPTKVDIDYIKIEPYETFHHGSFTIKTIATSHDKENSVAYIIEDNHHKLVFITDTGYIRNDDLQYLQGADIIIMESNHDPELLMKTNRPYLTKQRILSDKGHLSNETAGTILSQIVSSNTREILLAHLSEEGNTEELALNTVRRYLNGYQGQLRALKQYEIVSGDLEG